jgi:hypothetical protein
MRMIRALGSAFGGPTGYEDIDPETGETKQVKYGTGQRVLNAVSTIAGGMAAGAGEHGPGHIGKAAAAGAKAAMGMEENRKEETQNEYLRHAQVFRDHFMRAQQQQNLEWKKLEGFEKNVSGNKELLALVKNEQLEDASASAGEQGISNRDIDAKMKELTQDPDHKHGNLISIPVGVQEVTNPDGTHMHDSLGNPLFEQTWKIYYDKDVQLTPELAKKYSGLPGVGQLAPGQTKRASELYHLQVESDAIDQTQLLIQQQLKAVGLPTTSADTLDDSAKNAFVKFNAFVGGMDKDPTKSLDAFGKAGGNVAAVVKAYGGAANLAKISEDSALRQKDTKAADIKLLGQLNTIAKPTPEQVNARAEILNAHPELRPLGEVKDTSNSLSADILANNRISGVVKGTTINPKDYRVLPTDNQEQGEKKFNDAIKAAAAARSQEHINLTVNAGNEAKAALPKEDITGFKDIIKDPKEYNKRYDAFTKSKGYSTVLGLQGSYQEFQSISNNMGNSKWDPNLNGASSVVALFNAIGISATPLAGKGMRINQSTVEEHIGARGIGGAAWAKILSLKQGDVITPQQVRDYTAIAAQVYKDAYINIADEAHRQGLPVDFLPRGNNQLADNTTVDLFTAVVVHTHPELHGDTAQLKSRIASALDATGWRIR